ncbi:MAG: hypothetical protein QGF59_00915, partial [Pirellulaceae bacterium]|nr:hypothetical protein [Pirellulaceae bacterium]
LRCARRGSSHRSSSSSTHRWVITWKLNPDGTWAIKARLCLKGFAEKHFYGEHATKTYSPTAIRGAHKWIALFVVRNGFPLATMDVWVAFLKGLSFEKLKENEMLRINDVHRFQKMLA